MTALPSTISFTGASVTEDQFKSAFSDLRDFLAALLGTSGAAVDARTALGVNLGFASGTRLLFQQTAAPTGWTKESSATYNDCALRIVTGVVGTGGVDAFTTTFGAGKSTGGHSITQAELPACNFTVTDSGHAHIENFSNGGGGVRTPLVSDSGVGDSAATAVSTSTAFTGITVSSGGGNTAHSHTLSLNPKYADVIIASKD